MCGIAAIVERDPARVTPEADLAGMVAALLHRGPDEEGRVCILISSHEISRARGGPHCLTHPLRRDELP